MNKNQTWRRILTLICVMTMLVGIMVVGSVVASAAEDTTDVFTVTNYDGSTLEFGPTNTLAEAVDVNETFGQLAAWQGAHLIVKLNENYTVNENFKIDGEYLFYLDLNGHTLTIAEGATLSIAGKVQIAGTGTLKGNVEVADGATYTVADTVTVVNTVEVATYEELIAALAKDGAHVVMTADITATATQSSGYGVAGIVLDAGDVLDGNGKTLTIKGANTKWDCAIAMRGGEVKNLTIAGAMRGVFMPGANGDVVIDSCEFKNVVYTFNSDAGSKNYTVTIKPLDKISARRTP